ncbi:MAG: hypothetical protein IPP90_15460 [Gemmatimonadaceae bacterium]|nr:hypothetical protein [Gemmatimonadaceae bacterium]
MAMRGSAALMAVVLMVSACSGGATDSTEGANPKGQNLVIEGAIVGLAGSGMVLQNNGGNDLTVSAPANNFLFTGIAEKSSYNVTIRTQPTAPSQTCAVSNGSGSIKFDPIRNVAIACTTLTFAIKGGISNLTGTGLTVLLNGGGALAIPPGTVVFAFPPVPSGTRYDVTIGTQPSGQTCTMSGGSGTVGAVDVTTVSVSCSGAGYTIGGNTIGLGGEGLTTRLNGGAPLAIPSGSLSYTFPTVLQTGADYNVIIASQPTQTRRTCLLSNGRGRVGTSNVTNVGFWCHANGLLDSYTGTYAVSINGRRNYVTLWFDGTYSAAYRLDDASCTNSGNGLEYGVYKRVTSGVANIQIAQDQNGTCGLWYGGSTPGSGGGFAGTMVRNGNTLTFASTAETIVLEAVESVPTSLVGAFTRADGIDGSFIVFESDGTYLYQETQGSGGTVVYPSGVERGCYSVTGSTFTASVAASCRPNALPALDQNGIGGFSGRNGAAIPFVITSPTSITIGGVAYDRIAPAG